MVYHMPMSEILVVDDDRAIVKAIEIYLTKAGYTVYGAHNGHDALNTLRDHPDIRLAIVDVMMPGMDGISLTEKIRDRSSIPVIILSAKTEEKDKVTGLNAGADDYVSKPFSPDELVARVQSALRRYTEIGGLSIVERPDVITTGDLTIDDKKKTVTVAGKDVHLTPAEYNILLFLARNRGEVFSIRQIYENVWNEEAIGADNIVAVHIRHIREKIEINPKEPRYIKVVWGVGYKCE